MDEDLTMTDVPAASFTESAALGDRQPNGERADGDVTDGSGTDGSGLDGSGINENNETEAGGKTNGAPSIEEEEEEEDDASDDEYPEFSLPTGCYYDDRMRYHVHPDMSSQSHHPEDPRRIQEIWNAFVRAGLVFSGSEQRLAEIERTSPNRYMRRIPTRLATAAEITMVHSLEHYDWVMALADLSEAELRRMSREMDSGKQSVYVGGLSWLAASISAAGAIEVCRQVVAGRARNAFAVVRPPGHHAEWDHAMGFCLFNNVPVAVRVVQSEFETCRKVLILDWDVHHGNGVQNMFYNDASVLYISLHVWQDGRFYPGMPDNPNEPNAGIECVGGGNAAGYNVNIAWHDQGMGDGEYMAAFQKIVMPIAAEFDPDLVVISAGFDAAQGDELGGCEVTPACYAHMTHMLMGLAGGKVAVCLEGGYNLEAISKSAVAVAKTLMGHPPPRLTHGVPRINRDAAAILAKVQAVHAPYWSCMRPGVLDVAKVADLEGIRLHDVLRERQVTLMRDKHLMVPLYVHRDELYRSFEGQVLVSPGVASKKRIIMVLHDPPQIFGQPDPVSEPFANGLEAHNTWMIDCVMEYVDWAMAHDFGVIDVNVPPHVTRDDDSGMPSHVEELSDPDLERHLEFIMAYLWDNYIQFYDDDVGIYIVGIGRAYLGVRALLLNRECRSKIRGIVSFITSTLRPVKSETDHELASWYHDHTRLYLPASHPCFSNEKYRQMIRRRRYGTLFKSPHLQLTSMARQHRGDVCRWILGEGQESPQQAPPQQTPQQPPQQPNPPNNQIDEHTGDTTDEDSPLPAR